MKGSIVSLGAWRGRLAAARIVDGILDDLVVDPPEGGPPRPGTIFRALPDRPAKGLGGQFVRLPEGNGFLRGGQLPPGRPALVQVTGYAEPGKAIPVSTKLLFKGRFAIVTPGAPGLNVSRQIHDEEERDRLALIAAESGLSGAILRTAAVGADEAELLAELETLGELANRIAADIDGPPELLLDGPNAHEFAIIEWPAPDAPDEGFEAHEVPAMIDAMAAPGVDLPGGGSIWIEPTRALVAVDVNTAGNMSPAAGLKVNIAAIRDLPRQLRCRGLGGQIVIDPAPMPRKDRKQIESILRAALRKDTVETGFVGWTPLGHLELRRKRERFPL